MSRFLDLTQTIAYRFVVQAQLIKRSSNNGEGSYRMGEVAAIRQLLHW